MYQKILTKAEMKRIPPLYSQEKKGDNAQVVVKFFTPWAGWTWWVLEGNPIVVRNGEQVELEKGYAEVKPGEQIVDWRFFGMVHGHEKELGYFVLSELTAIRGRWGLRIERDMHFNPVAVGSLK